MKKKEDLIVCGPENIKTFNQRLKDDVPEFFMLVKRLHKEGMIDGLRGATIESTNANPKEITKTPHNAIDAAEIQCRHCAEFVADKIGDGNGIGQCKLGVWTRRSKWARTGACHQFKEDK